MFKLNLNPLCILLHEFFFFHFLFNLIELTNYMWVITVIECLVEKLQGIFLTHGVMHNVGVMYA